jgi:glycosyltransferase involved in cell wall biosynthesis
MPKVLILCAHRPRRSPSQRYRFEQYLPFLEKQGFAFTFSYLLNEKDDALFYSQGRLGNKIFILLKSLWIRLKDGRRFKQFDIIFIQRESLFLGTAFFEKRAARSGAKVIFDFDDSIWLADTSPGNKKWEWIKKPGKFFEAVAAADVVIAGNAYLAEKARTSNKNTVIIPTTIDTAVHFPRPELRNRNALTIGWSGSISTIKHFEMLLPVLQKIKETYGSRVQFKLIGAAAYTNPQLEIEAVAWTEATEVEQLNTLDIGIMPLPDDEWAKGKCGLKGLSYMACGVPAIMSPVGVNKDIVRHRHNGFLADTTEEWISILSELIENQELRTEIGKRGRETVVSNYSVEAHQQSYLKVFESAGKNR